MSRSRADDIAEGHRLNLIAYLNRVQTLPKPTRDLIFLHSEAGVAAGIEAATVDQLADMARNGQTEGLTELIASLPKETQEEIVATLARWSEEFALTPEKENAARVLVAAAGMVELAPATTALAAGAVLASPGVLPSGALADAVKFTQRCQGTQRKRLLSRFRARNDLFDDSRTRAALIGAFADFGDDGALIGKALAVSITLGDEQGVTALRVHADEDQRRLLEAAAPTVDTWKQQALAEEKEATENTEQAESEPDPPVGTVLERLGSALDSSIDSPVAAAWLARRVLELERPEADARVAAQLESLAPIADGPLAEAILSRARHQPIEQRPTWVGSVDSGHLESRAHEPIDKLVREAWSELAELDTDGDPYPAYLDQLAVLTRALGQDGAKLPLTEEAIAESLSGTMQDDVAATQTSLLSERGAQFVARGLASAQICADSFIGSACASAMEPLNPGEVGQLPEVRSVVGELLDRWVGDAGAAALTTLSKAAEQAPDATLDPTKVEALLRARCKLGGEGGEGEEGAAPIADVQIGALGRDYGDHAAAAVSAWLDCFGESSEVWLTVEPMWKTQISPALRDVLADAARTMPEKHRRVLVEAAVAASLTDPAPPSDNWSAIGLRDVKSGWLVKQLAEMAEKAPSDLERWRRLLDICRQRAPGSGSRGTIATNLLKPLAESGSDDAVNLMLEHLGLVGRKNAEELLEGLKLTADQRARAEDRLKELGFKKSGFRGLLDGIRGSSDPDE